MFDNIKLFLKNVESKNLSLIISCMKVCFIISLIGFFILYLSYENPISVQILYIGIKLLYIGFSYAIFSIICGLCIDKIKKEMN